MKKPTYCAICNCAGHIAVECTQSKLTYGNSHRGTGKHFRGECDSPTWGCGWDRYIAKENDAKNRV